MVNALLYFSPRRMQYKNYPNFLLCLKSSNIWKIKRQKIPLRNFLRRFRFALALFPFAALRR